MGWGDLVTEVYKDLLSPTAREAGKDIQRLYRDKLIRIRQRVIDQVPKDRRVKAHPQLAGPILDNLKYVQEGSIIEDLFVNLLARAIDKERVSEAHPAFVQIVKHLSPDEALILFHLKKEPLTYVSDSTHSYPYPKEDSELVSQVIFPENFQLYFDHLRNLNLVEDAARLPAWMSGKDDTESTINENLVLTDFGQMFARACVPDELPSNVKEPSATF